MTRVICYECHGEGLIRVPPTLSDFGPEPADEILCDVCNGEGYIEEVENATDEYQDLGAMPQADRAVGRTRQNDV